MGYQRLALRNSSEIFPDYSDKCDTFYNILLSDDIKRKAEIGVGFEDEFKGIKILTVGRLTVAKGYDVAIASSFKT